MFTHVMIGSNDLERARRFYDATFVALGGEPGGCERQADLRSRGRATDDHQTDEGKPATAANGGTIGIAAASRDHILA